MKLKLLKALTAVILFVMPSAVFAQPPTLGTAANFVLFTTNGAMTCSGTKYLTHLTGNVGSNLAGSVSGFGNVDGVIHDFDVASALCTPDVISLYTQLSTAIPTGTLASPFGNGTTLTPGVYSLTTASTLNLDLTLDAAGNPNAVFIFQIGGVFTTNASAKIKLINGALACNVFWQVNGAVNVGTGTFLRGTIVANGQIDMTSTLDTLEGRAFATNAAVLVSQLVAWTPIGCGSAYLTGPAAPALASTATYGVFSSIGAVTSTPVTYVIGDVGANSTTPTGFNPLNVTGTIHAMDPSTVAAASDLTNVYNYLVAMSADIDLLDPADFGHDLVLTPHSYQITGITQMTGNIILNAEGNPNAVFVIKVNGAFTTSTLSRVILINGAQAKNLYWKVDGAVDIFSNSLFNGTLVVAGAISLETGDTLNGRALTINGAIAINGSYVNIIPIQCVAAPITGTKHVCQGGTTTLADSDTGGVWSSSNLLVATIGSSSGIVIGLTPGTDTITYNSSLACIITTIVTVNAVPATITGLNTVCTGATITESDITPGGAWSSSNPAVATVGSNSGIVTGVTSGTLVITYTLPGSCMATKTITVNSVSGAGAITGPSTVCVGSSIILTDAAPGGIWSSSNASATVINGTVAGIVAGTDTISYSITSTCGTGTATKTVTINAAPNAGSITGASSVCVGSSITLTDIVSGGAWSASNTNVAVGTTGVVTGASAGADIISYSITGPCGTASATKTITVNASPDAGSITGASTVCAGSSITLTDIAAGGIWSSSNASAAVVNGTVTGIVAGIDTISYSVTSICGTGTATKTITINPMPNAGSISGPSSVCAGSSIALTDGFSGGAWSSSNARATVSGGSVTGISAGANTISYAISNSCGTATATHSLTVNPLPNAGSISGPARVCVSSFITLTDFITGGTWSTNNANATIGLTGTVTGVTAGNDTIMYAVTNMCGTATALAAVTVNALPNAGSISGPSNVCIASSIILTDAAAGGNWSASNANATVGTTGVVTGVTTGSDDISYAVTNICGTDIATKTITIHPLPNAGTISGSSAVCIGSSVSFTDAVTGGIWSCSNTNSTVSATGIVTGVTAGIATIRYAVANMCGIDTATKTITSNILPPVPVISTQTPSTACTGAMYQNFGTATPPPAGSTYNWTATNAVVWAQGTLHQYALINFVYPGIADVTLNAVITSTQCASKNIIVINAGPGIAQTATVSYFNNHFVCTPNNEGTYQWGYDDVHTLDSTILAGEINEDYINTSPDFVNRNYWAMTTTEGCLQKTYYHVPTTVQNINEVTSISVYPNPATSTINIEINADDKRNARVDVLSMMGQKVITVSTADNKAVLDVTALPAGLYIINCYRNDVNIAHARFIKN